MIVLARPHISIVMPVYNGAAFLPATIAAIQAQTFADFELLCVDDQSPDRSAAIILEVAKDDPRIRYLRSEENQGFVARVLNVAAPHVRGKHWVYTSQDDDFSTDWLQQMVDTLRREKADVVVTDLEQIGADGKPWASKINSWRSPISGREAFVLSLDWEIPTNALWPASYLTDVGYEAFGTYSDEYGGRKFFLRANKVAFAKGIFRYYHGNPEAITKKITPKLLDATYNEFRIWKLIDDTKVSEEWRREFAYRSVMSLIEASARLAKYPFLRPEAGRLDPAVAGMRTLEFRSALRDYCGSAGLRFWAMIAVIDSALVRALYARWLNAGRSAKQLLRRSSAAG